MLNDWPFGGHLLPTEAESSLYFSQTARPANPEEARRLH